MNLTTVHSNQPIFKSIYICICSVLSPSIRNVIVNMLIMAINL